MVEDRVALDRGDHADRDREQHSDDVGDADDGERVRKTLPDEIHNWPAAHERIAEVETCDRGDPLDVADRPRVVEAKRRADPLADFRRNTRVRSELREWIRRSEREDREDDKADDDERWDGDEEASQDVSAHYLPLTLFMRLG